jgi:hypothetical protein
LLIPYYKGGAQGFVTLDERVQAPLERFHIQGNTDANSIEQIIGGTTSLRLVKKPETLLSKRGGKGMDIFSCQSIGYRNNSH